jgi:hypothetical protein
MTRPAQRMQADWRRMLDAAPLRNRAAAVKTDGNGERSITVPRERPWWLRIPLVGWAVAVGEKRTLRLDRLGSEVWDLCDGQRTVEGIVDDFAQRHRLTFHEARAAVTVYLKTLVQRGALALEMPEEN